MKICECVSVPMIVCDYMPMCYFECGCDLCLYVVYNCNSVVCAGEHESVDNTECVRVCMRTYECICDHVCE